MRRIPLHQLPPASSPRPPHMDLLDSPSLPFPYPRLHQQLPQRFLADLHPVLLPPCPRLRSRPPPPPPTSPSRVFSLFSPPRSSPPSPRPPGAAQTPPPP